jgi:hypothetical protein
MSGKQLQALENSDEKRRRAAFTTLDIYAVPAMADEPERLFSQAGDAISSRRRRLSDDTVASLMCLRSWQSSGIITIDKSLFERAIEAVAVAESSILEPIT